MGYPMTFQRVLRRNALHQGDYKHVSAELPVDWRCLLNLTSPGLGTMDELVRAQWPNVTERIGNYERQAHALLGDLRRLESDTVDEKATCQAIAHRTGIDPEVVAVVLKEFLAW